jgi:hypothetical protein
MDIVDYGLVDPPVAPLLSRLLIPIHDAQVTVVSKQNVFHATLYNVFYQQGSSVCIILLKEELNIESVLLLLPVGRPMLYDR